MPVQMRGRELEREFDGQCCCGATDTQTHRETETQTHRHTDTQTHRHTETEIWVAENLSRTYHFIHLLAYPVLSSYPILLPPC
eukprot:798473-Rhodomonas_salina.1